jgi:hypothetical protein
MIIKSKDQLTQINEVAASKSLKYTAMNDKRYTLTLQLGKKEHTLKSTEGWTTTISYLDTTGKVKITRINSDGKKLFDKTFDLFKLVEKDNHFYLYNILDYEEEPLREAFDKFKNKQKESILSDLVKTFYTDVNVVRSFMNDFLIYGCESLQELNDLPTDGLSSSFKEWYDRFTERLFDFDVSLPIRFSEKNGKVTGAEFTDKAVKSIEKYAKAYMDFNNKTIALLHSPIKK